MNNNKIGTLYSWPVIIAAFIIFWPVGLFLLFKRTSIDKTAALQQSGKGLKIAGIVLMVLGAFGILGSLETGDGATIVGCLFFIAGGAIMFKKAKALKVEGEATKKYLAIIINNNVRQLDSIASATGKQYDVVKADIQKLIDKGFLKNAFINENTRELVIPEAAPTQSSTNNASYQQARVVSCPCCGANNKVSGATGECEYCGSPLN